MKSKLLPLSLFTIILGVTSIILAMGLSSGPDLQTQEEKGQEFRTPAEYFHKIRRNQVTHRVDQADVIKAREAAEPMAYKSGNSLNLSWESMGPDNAPGVVRAMVFDNQAESTQSLILAGVTGGIWRTENLGATWTKLNQTGQNLKVSCMVQDSEGNIYAGTGDGFCTDDIQYTQNNIYYSGIVGTGIYKSTDSDNFELLEATAPQITGDNDTIDFAYVYDIAYDEANSRLYSATNTGLFFSDDKGISWSKVTRYESDSITYGVTIHMDSTIFCDSLYVQGDTSVFYNEILEVVIDTTLFESVEESRIEDEGEFGIVECNAVEVSSTGAVMATFDNKVYISNGGDNPIFTNVSSNSGATTFGNTDFFSRDIEYYTTSLTVIDTNDQVYNRGEIQFTDTLGYENIIVEVSPFSSSVQGRTQIAIAPSDENVYYAACSDAQGFMENLYLSTDRGLTWEIIFPGGANTSLLPFDGSSCNNMTITVFPNNPYKILFGGDDLWLGERAEPGESYVWGAGPVSTSVLNPLDPSSYLPESHHNYVFFPGSNSKFAVATSKGVSFGTVQSGEITFQQIIRGLSTSQVYTLGLTGERHRFVSSIQGNGVQYVSGFGNTPETGEFIFGTTATTCETSVINPNAIIVSDKSQTGIMFRTNDYGLSFSLNFSAPNTNLLLTPFLKWESFNDHQSKTVVKFKADTTYYMGDELLCHSANRGLDGGEGYPFFHILDQDTLHKGDSIYVQDIVQSKFFIASHEAVFMTRDIIKFDSVINFSNSYDDRRNLWKILEMTGGFRTRPSAMDISTDGNYLFVGTENGKIYRLGNIQNIEDKATADVDSEFCVLATDEIALPELADRYITSIAIDPQDPNHMILTLGNYGNEDYVYQTMNALETNIDSIVFTDITGEPGELPQVPIYSSIIEMHDSDIALVGTELGVYSTQNLTSETPEWTLDASGIGKAMIVQMEQQKVYKAGIILEGPTGDQLVYPSVNNYGDIYCATFGRGVFRDGTFHQAVGLPEVYSPPARNKHEVDVNIFPNPVQSDANVSFNLASKQPVTLLVTDIAGKTVKRFELESTTEGNNNFSFDCSDLNSGVYILSLRSGNAVQNSKFIVK